MNINASIIDQRLASVMDEIRQKAADELNLKDEEKLKSLAFVYLCVKTLLDLDLEDAFDCLTDSGGDFGTDAFHISEEVDGEFVVTIFQGKYKRDLEGNANFPENGIKAIIDAIRHIFDPSSQLQKINDRLKVKVEEARSLIRDGYIPRVRAIACNNGLKWNPTADEAIQRANFGDQVNWEHVNHDKLVSILQRPKAVDETLKLIGKAAIEDMNFSRVCVGRIPVTEIYGIMKTHGDQLLERNIRRYLGLQGNRVNTGIRDTLNSSTPENFYFFNNGLTLICEQFKYNAVQQSDYQVQAKNLQIVNGGQTCMTIFRTLRDMVEADRPLPQTATVLVRLYELPSEDSDLVLQITQATNSQNPVDLKDLKSNDQRQRNLETSIQDLGYTYRRKRTDTSTKPTDITSGAAAEAVLAVWRQAPQQAKFFTREHFGKLYDRIFTHDLNGAQTVIAVLIYRMAENRRKRPVDGDPLFIRYGSCFIAMQMGRRLLHDVGKELYELDHRNFKQAEDLVRNQGPIYLEASIKDVGGALKDLYGDREVSLQQLSATFRRGDLINRLLSISFDAPLSGS
jgi:hypothetical protein